MMRSTQRSVNRARRLGLTYRSGFTLTEMLVVIGIVVLVLGIATPMITRAWRAGDRTRTAADLQAIAGALEAYRQDHGDYPRVKGLPWPQAAAPADTQWLGARMLCRALIGPGPGVATDQEIRLGRIPDGAGTRAGGNATDPETQNGPGFRTRSVTSGRVYGPYLPVDRFKLGDPNNPTATTTEPGLWAILDRYNKPYLYFPASPAKPNVATSGAPGTTPGYVHTDPTGGNSEFSYYDADDNLNAFSRTPTAVEAAAIQRLRLMLGDRNNNGVIDASLGETATTEKFLLWSAGPDELFGPEATLAEPKGTLDYLDAEKCDDVTNFRP